MTAATTPLARTRSEHEILVAGLIGGLAKLVVDVALGPLVISDPWGVLRRIAAIVLGAGVASPRASFGAGGAAIALLVHFALSLAYAYVLVAFLRRADRPRGVVIAAIYGVALYFVNLYVSSIVFPWFADLRGMVQVFAHVVFGVVVALVFYAMHPRTKLDETLPDPAPLGRRVH